MQVPQGDWYCQRCRDRSMVPSGTPEPSQLKWRTPGSHDYVRLSQMLGAALTRLVQYKTTIPLGIKGSLLG